MVRVNGVIAPLIQGVSQQPAQFRIEGQADEQINFFGDPVNGLSRRPPTHYIANLVASGAYKVASVIWNPYSVYIILYNSSTFRMFNAVTGAEQTVVIPDGLGYIGDSFLKFEPSSGACYVLNPTKTIAKLNDVPVNITQGGIFFLLGGQFVRSYKIVAKWRRTAGGTVYTAQLQFDSPHSGNTADLYKVQTWYIAEQFVVSALANTTFTTDFEIVRTVDCVYMYPKAGRTAIDLEFTDITDGDGGINLYGITRKAVDIGKLPKYAPHKYVLEVTESNSTEADNYWLEYHIDGETVGSGFGKQGVWVETTSPYEKYRFDPSTTPMIMYQTGASEFTLQRSPWADRATGDDNSNPFPSFTGYTIEDLSLFQGRLVAISNSNVIMSRTNKHGDWFSNSATGVADSDPIDVRSDIGSYYLRYIVPYNRDLVIFADKAQFVILGRNALTPQNVSLVLSSNWESNLSTKPELSGNSIFYNVKSGGYSIISELFADGTQDVFNSVSITQNIPEYIQGTVLQFVNPSGFNKLFVRTDAALNIVYVHEYLWVGDKKVQSSWSKLVFPCNVLEMTNLDNRVYIVLQNGTKLDLLFMQLDNTPTPNLDFRMHLDYIVSRTGIDKTFTIPYNIVDNLDDYLCVQHIDCPNNGLETPIESIVGSTVTLKNSMGGGAIRFGRKYLSEYTITRPFVKDNENQKLDGHIAIQNFVFNYQKTGAITFTCFNTQSPEITEFTNIILGGNSNILGSANVNTGSTSVPVFKNTQQCSFKFGTDKHTPIQIQSIEWNGTFNNRRRRV